VDTFSANARIYRALQRMYCDLLRIERTVLRMERDLLLMSGYTGIYIDLLSGCVWGGYDQWAP